MRDVEETQIADPAQAARAARRSDLVARCLRAELRAVLAEAEDAVTSEDGSLSVGVDALLFGALLRALAIYVRFGTDPAASLLRHSGEDRRRCGARLAERVAVEREREKLAAAQVAAALAYGQGGSHAAVGAAGAALLAFEAAHPAVP